MDVIILYSKLHINYCSYFWSMTNTRSEKVKLKNVIVWILLLGIVVLLMSTSVQAKELTEINATDILKQIENGEDVFLRDVRIIGELNLSKIELETVPNAEWDEDIVFYVAESSTETPNLYSETYDLEKKLKIVESNIVIRNSIFEEDVDFSNTKFRRNVVFTGTSFSSNAGFWYANFTDNAFFQDANFAGTANFNGANFVGTANFNDANFAGDAGFWRANFAGTANFGFANFAGDAFFQDANFAGDAFFQDANFAGDAFFQDANFAGTAFFQDANFAGTATFFSAEFDKVLFTETTFTKVYLTKIDFNRMYGRWISFNDVLESDGETYIKLIKNFREIEQFEDADAAYYQYRRLSQANKEWSVSKLWDVVAGASCGMV